MIRVAIVGGAGRMGQILAQGLATVADPANEQPLAVVALIDPHEPEKLHGAEWNHSIDELKPDAVDVVVDFSVVQVARTTIEWCLSHEVAGVIGTTGFSAEE